MGVVISLLSWDAIANEATNTSVVVVFKKDLLRVSLEETIVFTLSEVGATRISDAFAFALLRLTNWSQHFNVVAVEIAIGVPSGQATVTRLPIASREWRHGTALLKKVYGFSR